MGVAGTALKEPADALKQAVGTGRAKDYRLQVSQHQGSRGTLHGRKRPKRLEACQLDLLRILLHLRCTGWRQGPALHGWLVNFWVPFFTWASKGNQKDNLWRRTQMAHSLQHHAKRESPCFWLSLSQSSTSPLRKPAQKQ